jgi:Kef-type K+ transport system membrane component KefB/nucleotide-binding universal stress UspA family protein
MTMLTPVGEHELLLFWIQLVLLLAAARGMGALAQHFNQPRVVGELGAGVILGPSVFGRLFPDLASWIFPGGGVQSALLLAIAWLGIVLLLVVTGFETDLALLRRLGKPAVSLSTGSLVVPLVLGFGTGWIMPETLWGDEANRLGFALFIGVALSISALPVIAKIMVEMDLMRRNVGQLTIAAAMANDLIGWMLLGVVVGIFTAGVVDVAGLSITVGSVVAFLVLGLTIGQRIADRVLRQARAAGGFGAALSATLLVVFVLGAITQALGVEAVLGALIAGVILGRSRYQRHDVKRSIEVLSNNVFAPIFFATAGLYVDLAVLLEPTAMLWAGIVLAVAAIAKLLGSFLGGRFAGMSSMESLAAGIGLNARGAMEIVLATIGLALGALNDASYAIIVLLAVATSMAAPPLLRPALRRVQPAGEEAERLQQEEVLSKAVIANTQSALLPTRGGLNSVLAAKVLDALLQPSAHVTIFSVRERMTPSIPELDEVRRVLVDRTTDLRVETRRPDPAAEILREASLGHRLLTLGLNDDYAGSHELSAPIQRVIAETPIPLLLVRRGSDLRGPRDMDGREIRRIVLGVTGTLPGRAAEEIAFRLSTSFDAEVLAIHVVTRGEASDERSATVERQLTRVQEVATTFGSGSRVESRRAAAPAEELVRAADEWRADTIVLGSTVRPVEGRPFLGHGTEWLLEHAKQTVICVVYPLGEDRPE